MRYLWLLVTFLLFSALAMFAQSTNSPAPKGTISGTVLDEHGRPMKGAQVCTYVQSAPSGSSEAHGGCPARTDEAGEFRIDHVAMGPIGVEAIKLEEGYVAFAGTSVHKEVTLTPSEPSATVLLELGPKPAFVLATVNDKFTGKIIPRASIGWVLIEPQGQTSGGTNVYAPSTPVPLSPEKYLVLTVSAPGYKGWLYSDPLDPSRPAFLRLRSGEQKELVVELEPQTADPTAVH